MSCEANVQEQDCLVPIGSADDLGSGVTVGGNKSAVEPSPSSSSDNGHDATPIYQMSEYVGRIYDIVGSCSQSNPETKTMCSDEAEQHDASSGSVIPFPNVVQKLISQTPVTNTSSGLSDHIHPSISYSQLISEEHEHSPTNVHEHSVKFEPQVSLPSLSEFVDTFNFDIDQFDLPDNLEPLCDDLTLFEDML